MVKLLQVVFEVSVSFPNEEVSCDEGKGIRNRTATEPPKIIRDITRGISRFTIRALFCAELRLWLLFILAVASDSISFRWLSNSNEVFTSFGSKVSRNWELLASMWFRNGSDELLLIQLARKKSEKKTIHKLCALCVPSSCFNGGGHPYRNDGRPLSTRSGTQSTYCIRWKLWGCLIGGCGGWLRRKRKEEKIEGSFQDLSGKETTPYHILFTRLSYKGPITLTFSIMRLLSEA